jgi:hypothetical protein
LDTVGDEQGTHQSGEQEDGADHQWQGWDQWLWRFVRFDRSRVKASGDDTGFNGQCLGGRYVSENLRADVRLSPDFFSRGFEHDRTSL